MPARLSSWVAHCGTLGRALHGEPPKASEPGRTPYDVGVATSYTPCRYAQRWPDLWAQLPDDSARQRLSDTLANGRLEGMEPDRALVEDLVADERGEITDEEFMARLRARTVQRRADRAAAVR